jgi:hypothetical protein
MDQATADKLRQDHYDQEAKERAERVRQAQLEASGHDETSKRARRILADTAEATMRAYIKDAIGKDDVMEVHWDDCDMDVHRFWFHFRDRTLIQSHCTGDGHARKMSGLIRRAMTAAIRKDKRLAEHKQYSFDWSFQYAPEVEKREDGQTRKLSYTTATWCYVLSVQG